METKQSKTLQIKQHMKISKGFSLANAITTVLAGTYGVFCAIMFSKFGFQPKLMITLIAFMLIAFISRGFSKVYILPVMLNLEIFEDSFLLSYEEKAGMVGPCISASMSEIKSIVYDRHIPSIIFHGNLHCIVNEHVSDEPVVTLKCKDHEVDLILGELRRMWGIKEEDDSLIHEGDFSTLEGMKTL